MQMFTALDFSPDCLIIKSTHASKLLSQNNHALQEAPSRKVSADAGKGTGSALPKPRNPIPPETKAFPRAQVPTRNGCFPRSLCWTEVVNCQKEFVYLCGCGEKSSDDFLIMHIWLNAMEM